MGGYSGARLASICRPETARVASLKMARKGSEHLHKRVVDNTPIDDSPFPSRAPGTARASWRVKPVTGPYPEGEDEAWYGGVESGDKVTRFLEEGTGLYGPEHRSYFIFPKVPGGMLHFFNRKTGEWVFARYVEHPGIHAQHPLKIGAAITEHELPMLLLPELEAWKRSVEMLGAFERATHPPRGI